MILHVVACLEMQRSLAEQAYNTEMNRLQPNPPIQQPATNIIAAISIDSESDIDVSMVDTPPAEEELKSFTKKILAKHAKTVVKNQTALALPVLSEQPTWKEVQKMLSHDEWLAFADVEQVPWTTMYEKK